MGESSSRRSFLFGRQATAEDDWSKFVIALRRACQGAVKLVAERQAHLQPGSLDDVVQARKLAHAHHVTMALDGLELAAADQAGFVLWVEAGSAWGSLIPLGDTGLWRVDAGCPMAVMQAAGLVHESASLRSVNLAQWFAAAYRHIPLSDLALSKHLVSVDWLLPDGTIEVFGAFGTHDAQPLGSLAAQRLVPKLFELSLAANAIDGVEQGLWPSCFHLDALTNVDQVNLAHFFIGHGGSLGWLVAATFKKTDDALETRVALAANEGRASELDARTKLIVDPDKVFVSPVGQTR